jgi:hypothetical protein
MDSAGRTVISDAKDIIFSLLLVILDGGGSI